MEGEFPMTKTSDVFEHPVVAIVEPIQSSLFAVLAAVGKLLGYHRALQRLSYA
jgi:hypothetical protein